MQVATNLPPAIQAQYNAYKQQEAIRKAEQEQEAQRIAQQKAAAKALWDAAKLNQIHTHKKDVELICDCCGKIIPVGTKYRQQNRPRGHLFTEGFDSRITHLVCAMEGKQ